MTPRFLHVGLAVPDLDAASRFFADALDHVVARGPFEDPLQGARVVFLVPRTGHGEPVELVAPASDASHVHRLVARASGAYHVCYEVDGLEAAIGGARAAGATLVREPAPAVAFGGRRIAWLYSPTRALLEYVEAASPP